jgi:hypothetical protein
LLILRIAALAVAVALGLLVVLYMLSGDRKYLRTALQVFKVALAFVLAVLLVLAFERLTGLA